MQQSGAAGCSCAHFALGHPFDLTKTRLQTAPPGTYTGAVDVVKKALARDGITGYVHSLFSQSRTSIDPSFSLYRGVVPPLLGVTPIFAVSFWVSHSCATIHQIPLRRKSKGLRYVEASHPQLDAKSDKQRVVDTRPRSCRFPVCDTYDSCDRTSSAGESSLAGE